jgi:hypothetical protein
MTVTPVVIATLSVAYVCTYVTTIRTLGIKKKERSAAKSVPHIFETRENSTRRKTTSTTTTTMVIAHVFLSSHL